ncbi:MAG: DUF2815 family protein [Eubacteriales bacterium]
MASDTTLVTGKVRLSYAHLFEPHRNPNAPADSKPKYGATILIPKDDKETLDKIRKAQKAALEKGKDTRFGGTIPKAWKSTLRDADSPEEEDMLEKNPEYAGHYFMAVSNTMKPGLVDRDRSPIIDQTEIYSGCYARVQINAFPFNTSGNKGVSFGLNNVQKLADGEPFGAVVEKAEDVFGAVDGDDDGLI